MRGKQAAAAANRRADAAEQKARDLAARLKTEREARDEETKALKKEIGDLKSGLIEEAARLASAEILRLKEEIIVLTGQLSEANEHRREASKARDYLMRNMCKYISMTKGLPPTEAVTMAATWLTNEQFSEKTDTATIAMRLDLPPDGWVMTELRRAQTYMVAESLGGHQAVPLDEVDTKLDQFTVHKRYQPDWYEKMRAPRLDRPQKGVMMTLHTTASFVAKPRASSEDEESS